MTKTLLSLSALALMTLFAGCGGNPVYEGEGAAIHGYDAVSYFDDDPVVGDPSISLEHRGTTWHFSTEENKARFEADADRYRPRYGGWCAVAMADGIYFPSDPLQYDVFEGQLFLVASASALETFRADRAGERTAADQTWTTTQPDFEIPARPAVE